MDARTLAWIDQADAYRREMIRKHGWMIQYVGDECTAPGDHDDPDDHGPPFAYTIGLFGLDHPELLIFGLPPRPTAQVLNAFGERIRQGENVMPGQVYTLAGIPHRFAIEVVPNPGEIALGANDFYRRPPEHSVPLLQLSYDEQGLFPWEDGYPHPDAQPRPGTFRA